MKRNSRQNKSSPRGSNSLVQRKNLINKLSEAIKLKYNNVFTVANYDENSLKSDIDKLLSSQYYNKDPREIFKPIESDILQIVKQKNPQLKIQPKKAKKLPDIKYTLDKYQEADNKNTNLNNNKVRNKSKSKTSLLKKNNVNNNINI